MKSTIIASLIMAMATLLNCFAPQLFAAENSTLRYTIQGKVSYLQKIALPQHAFLIVQLVDMNNENGPFPIIGETAFQPSTEVPINFSIKVDKEKIDINKAYALQAKIVVGDILWFVSEVRVAVNLKDKDSQYDINLVLLNQNNNQNTITSIIGQEWLVEDIFAGGIIDSSNMIISIEDKDEPTKEQSVKKYHATGSGGCNHYNTNVLINETTKTVDFEMPVMTFITCAQAISQQEGRFIEMLGKANSYMLDDLGRLILLDEQGNYIGRLVPNI